MATTKKKLFTQMMQQNKGIIYKIVNSYCQHQDDRQDLAQEILTTMWLAFDKYNNEYKFSTWMYRISLNVAISYYRKDSQRQDRSTAKDLSMVHIADLSEERGMREDIDQLYEFIGQLDQLNKAIMLLYLENEPHDVIATSLGITNTNVATRIGRIKQTLRHQFNAQRA